MRFMIRGILVMTVFIQCTRVLQPPSTIKKMQAEDYVEMGMVAFEKGDWKNAALSFNKAIKRNPEYAPSYAGMALVLASRDQPEKALEYSDKAIDVNERSPLVHVIKGRVLTIIKDEDWFDRAIEQYDKALNLKADNEYALYYKSSALLEKGDYEEASELLRHIAEKQGLFQQKARAGLEHVNRLIKAAPQSQVGYDLVEAEQITRGDLAALLSQEIHIIRLLNKRNPHRFASSQSRSQLSPQDQKRQDAAARITDIAGHWAESWIRDVVRVGVMDVYPDYSFRPHEPIRRVNFAMTIQHIIILITGNTSLDTAYIGSPSIYPDVAPSHYAYNAVHLVSERRILTGDPLTGEFNLNGTISGLDALLALRALQNTLPQYF